MGCFKKECHVYFSFLIFLLEGMALTLLGELLSSSITDVLE
jgi:hypothetical protein